MWHVVSPYELLNDQDFLVGLYSLGTNYTAPNPSLHLSEPSSLTSLHQDGELNAYFEMANSEVGPSHSQRMMVSAAEFDWMEPPSPPETTAESISGEGSDSIMLEAFHRFQHNPQVQVSMAIY